MNLFRSLLGLTPLLLSHSLSAAPFDYTVAPVAEGIYYHQGLYEEANTDNMGAIANVSFVIGDKCVAIIDAGGSFAEGQALRDAVRQHTDKPICYVIDTHVHPDHLLGSAAFKEDHPEYIGHEHLPKAIASREEFYARNFAEILGDAYTGTEFIQPTQTVKPGKPLTIDLGQRKLTLTAYSTSHTDNDLTVFDQKTKTLWTGDLLFINHIPVLDGSINGWIKNSEVLANLDVTYVVPGHGPASKDLWQQGWEKQLHYLRSIRDQIRQIVAVLGTIEQATDSVGLEEKDNWKLFENYHRRNVTAAFVELEWE